MAEFEAVYRANVAGVTSFFARRCGEPQEVADLTSETFTQAIGSLGSFDPRRGTPRACLRLMWDMKTLIEQGIVEAFKKAGSRRWFDTTQWETHRAVIARRIPNSAEGDDFWRGLAHVYGTALGVRHLTEIVPQPMELPSNVAVGLSSVFHEAVRAYESLTGTLPDVHLSPPEQSPTGARTGAQEPDAA